MEAVAVGTTISYDVRAVDLKIRRTNNLLRLLNAARATVEDLKALSDEPTLAEFFWTLVQLLRTFTALRRLFRSLQVDTRALIGARGGRAPLIPLTTQGDPRQAIDRLVQDIGLIGINVDASINNVPVPIDRIDLSNIPDLTLIQLQQIMEEEGPRMEADARRLLDERIIHRDRSTGRLGRSTRWISRLPGITLEAVAPYSFWVEEGQRSFTGHHFLRDAADLARPRLQMKIADRLNILIRDGRVN